MPYLMIDYCLVLVILYVFLHFHIMKNYIASNFEVPNQLLLYASKIFKAYS
jgi:hypothetical protein